MAACATRRLYNINDATFKCFKSGGCNRELRLKLCRTGKNTKRYYLNCDNPCHEKELWFWFGAGETPSGSAASPTAAASTTTTPSPALPVSAQAVPTCAELHCPKTRVANLCDNRMCLAHCRARGSCRLHEHEPAKLPRRVDPISVISSEFDYARHPRPPTHTATPAPTPSPAPSTPLAEQQSRFNQSLDALQASSPRTSLAQSTPRTFRCITWYVDGAPAIVEGVQTTTWPTWCKPDDGAQYAYFSTYYREWVTVRPGFVHTVSDDEPLFIRCPPDVVGSDKEDQFARLPAMRFPIPAPQPARKRRALHSEDDKDEVVVVDYRPLDRARQRRSVHTAAASTPYYSNPISKSQGKRRAPGDDNDDIVVVGYIPAIKQEPTSPPPRTRPSLTVHIPEFYPSVGSSSESSLPGLSSSSSSAAASSSLASPASSNDDFPSTIFVPRARKSSWTF
ncbi:hypothetical protein DFH07DRAFT_963183 [Mycena maculata]|uniref:Uncharacterized protein n=1 Tax=Mycena maculata TaxID=230809 RepID=A0AAD7INE1_9AGAR|nr:hypothetical protein DFH07DRAFT_963183 [Mycena maculata]